MINGDYLLLVHSIHDKSGQKEILSHTLNNKVISLIFFVLHEKNIEEDKEKKSMKPPPALVTFWILEQ